MATSKICLDTDIVIDHLRGRPQAFVNAVLQFNPYITSVTLFELESADFLSERQMQLLQRVYSTVGVLSF